MSNSSRFSIVYPVGCRVDTIEVQSLFNTKNTCQIAVDSL